MEDAMRKNVLGALRLVGAVYLTMILCCWAGLEWMCNDGIDSWPEGDKAGT